MVPENYPELVPWVNLVLTLIALQCFLMPLIFVVPKKKEVYTKEFMAQFSTIHHEAFEELNPPDMALPDMGNGRFSQELSYKNWFDINNAQRVHLNFVELLPVIIVLIKITSLT